jgi:hypothetical protein
MRSVARGRDIVPADRVLARGTILDPPSPASLSARRRDLEANLGFRLLARRMLVSGERKTRKCVFGRAGGVSAICERGRQSENIHISLPTAKSRRNALANSRVCAPEFF